MKKLKSGYPFIPSSENPDVLEGAFASIRSLDANPNWVVKELAWVLDEEFKLYLYKSKDNPAEPLPPMTLERFKAEVAHHKEILDNDPTNFRHYIPDNSLVYGTNEKGEERGFIAMKAVVGTEIENLDNISPERLELIEKLILDALLFYDTNKKVREDGTEVSYFPDLIQPPHQDDEYYELHNIMLGRLADQPKETPESIFVIDTYPLYVVFGDNDRFFQNLAEAVDRFEDRYQVRLEQVNDALGKYHPVTTQ